jgi:hypothetical protein
VGILHDTAHIWSRASFFLMEEGHFQKGTWSTLYYFCRVFQIDAGRDTHALQETEKMTYGPWLQDSVCDEIPVFAFSCGYVTVVCFPGTRAR